LWVAGPDGRPSRVGEIETTTTFELSVGVKDRRSQSKPNFGRDGDGAFHPRWLAGWLFSYGQSSSDIRRAGDLKFRGRTRKRFVRVACKFGNNIWNGRGTTSRRPAEIERFRRGSHDDGTRNSRTPGAIRTKLGVHAVGWTSTRYPEFRAPGCRDAASASGPSRSMRAGATRPAIASQVDVVAVAGVTTRSHKSCHRTKRRPDGRHRRNKRRNRAVTERNGRPDVASGKKNGR
jgi:hypothetical protein